MISPGVPAAFARNTLRPSGRSVQHGILGTNIYLQFQKRTRTGNQCRPQNNMTKKRCTLICYVYIIPQKTDFVNSASLHFRC